MSGIIAASAGANAFIPDYRLAPEHVFPAAVADVESCYDGLIERGFRRIAVVGDSAGGALALGPVTSRHRHEKIAQGGVIPISAVALSPVTDPDTFRRELEKHRAAADPYFTESQALQLVTSYLEWR